MLLLVRTTKTEQAAGRMDGMTLLLVVLQSPSVDTRPIRKAARNAVASCEVRYDDYVVAVADRVGEEGKGLRHLLDDLNPERILVASEALGFGKAPVGHAVEYAGQCKVSDRAIGAKHGIAFPLAEAHTRLHAAELAVREVSWRND